MKLLKIALVVAVMLVNLAIVQPSWADPNYTKNPDYIEVKKTLDKLQKNATGTIPEDVQRQISELTFQKTAIESGVNWGQCRNETGETLAIYGAGNEESESSSYDNQLYFLATGQSTPEQWDCQGVYLPSDVKVAGLNKTGASAVRILDGTQLLVKKNAETSDWEFNIPSVKVVNPEEANWYIPNVSQAFVNSRVPSNLTSGENG